MLKLFAVTLGGRADRCNIELHDVVFVVGHSLEETYSSLIDKWFGNKKRLHIDSTIELKYVDGHEVLISKAKPKQDKKFLLILAPINLTISVKFMKLDFMSPPQNQKCWQELNRIYAYLY